MSTLALLLKESWRLVEDRADDLANQFYARIFLADPGLRDLFPVHMTVQRARLLDAIVATVQLVDDPDRFGEFLHGLGQDHRKFHVRPAHYALVGEALLRSLRALAGQRWSIEYDQAWRDAYDAMATRMIRGAREGAYQPPYWHAEVTAHERRGRDIAVFTCRPLDPFPYRAGQYVSVECRYHPRTWRTYSIANAPRADGTLDFHVRAWKGGWVSAALVRQLQIGDMIRLGSPMGSMTLFDAAPYTKDTRDIVCVGGGTGVAPLKAIIEDVAKHTTARWAHLFFGARNRDELYDLPELRRMATRYSWLSVIPVCSEDPSFAGEQGAVHEAVQRFGPWQDHDFFVCGSPGMVRATLGSLSAMSIPDQRVYFDAIDCRREPASGALPQYRHG